MILSSISVFSTILRSHKKNSSWFFTSFLLVTEKDLSGLRTTAVTFFQVNSSSSLFPQRAKLSTSSLNLVPEMNFSLSQDE